LEIDFITESSIDIHSDGIVLLDEIGDSLGNDVSAVQDVAMRNDWEGTGIGDSEAFHPKDSSMRIGSGIEIVACAHGNGSRDVMAPDEVADVVDELLISVVLGTGEHFLRSKFFGKKRIHPSDFLDSKHQLFQSKSASSISGINEGLNKRISVSKTQRTFAAGAGSLDQGRPMLKSGEKGKVCHSGWESMSSTLLSPHVKVQSLKVDHQEMDVNGWLSAVGALRGDVHSTGNVIGSKSRRVSFDPLVGLAQKVFDHAPVLLSRRQFEVDSDLFVILHSANTGKIDQDLVGTIVESMFKMLSWSNSCKHEELSRVDSSSSQDDFPFGSNDSEVETRGIIVVLWNVSLLDSVGIKSQLFVNGTVQDVRALVGLPVFLSFSGLLLLGIKVLLEESPGFVLVVADVFYGNSAGLIASLVKDQLGDER